MTSIEDRAAEIYAAMSLLEEGRKDPAALGIGELVRFVTEPDFTLTDAQTRRLFSDEGLRTAYRDLKARAQMREVPALRAASDEDMEERSFPGGQLLLVPASRGRWIYLRIVFSEPLQGPAWLEIARPDGVHAKLVLDPPNERDEIVMALDPDDAGHAAVLAALRDPRSTGSIMPMPERLE